MSEHNFSDVVERQALAGDLHALNFAVHQPNDPALFTPEPHSAMVPWHWRAVDIRRSLERLGASLKLEPGGVRR